MPVRGIVAFGDACSWRGVYVHTLSQPTELGPMVWSMLVACRLNEKFLFAHPGGFHTFPDECFCHSEKFAGRTGSCAKDSPYYLQDYPSMTFTNVSADPVVIDWLYVVELNQLNVLRNYDTGLTGLKRGARVLYRTHIYSWGRVAAVSLLEDEPDWKQIERVPVIKTEVFYGDENWKDCKAGVGVSKGARG